MPVVSYTLIIAEKRESAQRIAKALDDKGTPTRFEEQGVPYFEAQNDGGRLLIVPAVGHLYTIAPSRKDGAYYPLFNVKWTEAYQFDKKAAHTERWIAAISKLSEGASTFISHSTAAGHGRAISLYEII